MAPSGDLGTNYDHCPLPGPSETYDVPATLGFTLHPILPELMRVSARVGHYTRPFLESN